MSEREIVETEIEDAETLDEDVEDGFVPGLDLQLGDESEISGGDDLATQDEENMYGNDVLADDEE